MATAFDSLEAQKVTISVGADLPLSKEKRRADNFCEYDALAPAAGTHFEPDGVDGLGGIHSTVSLSDCRFALLLIRKALSIHPQGGLVQVIRNAVRGCPRRGSRFCRCIRSGHYFQAVIKARSPGNSSLTRRKPYRDYNNRMLRPNDNYRKVAPNNPLARKGNCGHGRSLERPRQHYSVSRSVFSLVIAPRMRRHRREAASNLRLANFACSSIKIWGVLS